MPVKASDIRPDTFYLATVPSVGASLVPGMEKVELVPGDKLQAAGRAAIATLLFVCRCACFAAAGAQLGCCEFASDGRGLRCKRPVVATLAVWLMCHLIFAHAH